MTKLDSHGKPKVEIKKEEQAAVPKVRYFTKLARQQAKWHSYYDMAGINRHPHDISKIVFNISIFLNLVLSGYLLYIFSTSFKTHVLYVLVITGLVWTLVFVVVFLLVWLVFFVSVDLRILQRRAVIEDVLPEFLQLAAANVRAGMPIDRAMWFAMRPKFGIFATEIELVAKSTFSGEDFSKALLNFSKRYNSPLLSRAVSLIVEGASAGGEIGGLLNRIAEDLTEVKLLKKDMAASVTMYIIFIGVATMLAAPILFALSTQLIGVITMLSTTLDTGQSAQTTGLGVSIAQVAIQESDFKIFSIAMLAVTSFFAACTVATIKKGSIGTGFRYIPIFMAVSIAFYLIMQIFLEVVFGNIIVI